MEESSLCKWYADDDLVVYFSSTPDVDFRVIEPNMTKEQKNENFQKSDPAEQDRYQRNADTDTFRSGFDLCF